MPRDGPNQYTINVYELSTWTQTTVTVDERLCANQNNKPGLLGCSPSKYKQDI